MEEIIEILMRRDGISEIEAYAVVEECIADLRDAIRRGTDLVDCEEIIAYHLGLEPDYFDILVNELC